MGITISGDGSLRSFNFSGSLTFRDNAAFTAALAELDKAAPGPLTFDFSGVDYVDSFGIGLLVLANDEAAKRGLTLHVLNVQPAVEKLLGHFGLVEDLRVNRPMVGGAPSAQHHALEALTVSPPRVEGRRVVVALSGQFTLGTQSAFLPVVEGLTALTRGQTCVLELGGLDFIDSSGVSMLLSFHDQATRAGIATMLDGPCGRVKEMLRLSALDTVMFVTERG
ncbi:MAG: STAS domain-containing protein [Magnetospirillum sp.]|nr:STAS domain-containing protein [Magnetospirillum sp.]